MLGAGGAAHMLLRLFALFVYSSTSSSASSTASSWIVARWWWLLGSTPTGLVNWPRPRGYIAIAGARNRETRNFTFIKIRRNTKNSWVFFFFCHSLHWNYGILFYVLAVGRCWMSNPLHISPVVGHFHFHFHFDFFSSNFPCAWCGCSQRGLMRPKPGNVSGQIQQFEMEISGNDVETGPNWDELIEAAAVSAAFCQKSQI